MTPHRRLVPLLAAFLILLSLSAPTAARQDSPAAPLDLAAMALTPADLAAAGWDGLGLTSGWTLSATDLADRAAWPSGAGEEREAVRAALLAAGWQQGYAATFATFWDPNRTNLGRQVDVEIVAYADGAGAAQGFALIPDAFPTGPIAAVSGAGQIGDEARLVRVAARDPQAGEPSQELALGFRRDRLTARVLLRDWTGAEPAVATVEALATRLLARIDQVSRDGGPGLSTHVLRVAPLENAVSSDAYVRIDGEDVRSTYESPAEFAARVASYGAATDVFTSETEIAVDDRGYRLGYGADLYRFPDEQQAAFWLHARPARLTRGADVAAYALDDRLTGIADEAAAVTLTRDPGLGPMDVSHVAAVLVRAGAVVAEIRLTRPIDPAPAAAARELAAAQAACLASAGCLRPRPAPAAIAGG